MQIDFTYSFYRQGWMSRVVYKIFNSKVSLSLSMHVCMHAQLFCCVQLFANLCAVAYQAPLYMDFSRQEYWSGLPFPSPGKLHRSLGSLSELVHVNASWIGPGSWWHMDVSYRNPWLDSSVPRGRFSERDNHVAQRSVSSPSRLKTQGCSFGASDVTQDISSATK